MLPITLRKYKLKNAAQIKKCRPLRSDICRICTRKVTTPIKFVKHSMTNYQRKSITLPEKYACRTIKVFTRKFYKCGISYYIPYNKICQPLIGRKFDKIRFLETAHIWLSALNIF